MKSAMLVLAFSVGAVQWAATNAQAQVACTAPAIDEATALIMTPGVVCNAIASESRNSTVAQADQGQLMLRFQLIEASRSTAPRDPAIASVDSVLRDLFRYTGYQLISEAVVAGAASGGNSVQILNGRGETYQLDVSIYAPIVTRGGRGAGPQLDGEMGRGTGSQLEALVGKVAGLQVDGRSRDVVISVQPPPIQIRVTLRSVPAFSDSPNQGGAANQGGGGQLNATAQTVTQGNMAAAGRGSAYRTILETSVTISPGHTVVLGSTQPGGPDRALILVMRPEIRKY